MMKVVLMLSWLILVAGQQTSTPAPEANMDMGNKLFQKSLVSTLLQVTGFSQACVAAALDTCAPSSLRHQPPPPNPLVQVMACKAKKVMMAITTHKIT